MSIIGFSRSIGPVALECVVSEHHTATLEITQNPVEQGADITDHAYRTPGKLVMEIKNGAGAATMAALEAFQVSRVPFIVVSGLKVYRNMLIREIAAERDNQFASVFSGTVEMDEIIIASTATAPDASAARSGQAGGENSTRSRHPSKASSSGIGTQQRASGRVSRGDTAARSVATSSAGAASRSTPAATSGAGGGSILSSVFG